MITMKKKLVSKNNWKELKIVILIKNVVFAKTKKF